MSKVNITQIWKFVNVSLQINISVTTPGITNLGDNRHLYQIKSLFYQKISELFNLFVPNRVNTNLVYMVTNDSRLYAE